MSRFAIVGCEASGKTVLTAALADFFRPGQPGRSCSMVPENMAAHRFAEYTYDQMRVRHAWPQATNPDKATTLAWTMRIDGSVVADLEMLDFGGEVFRAAFREGEPTESGVAAQDELLSYLSSSDFIVVTVSLDVLARDLDPTREDVPEADRVRDSEARWVTRGILDFVRRRLPSETGLVVALTQADRYAQELEALGGPDGFFAKAWPTVAALYPDVPVVAVSSVSAVAEDGSPAEGYTCEGVLPLMSVFADYCVGGVDALRQSIAKTFAALRDAADDADPRTYRRQIEEYSDLVRTFAIASGLTGDWYGDELKTYVDALVNAEGVIEKKLRRLEAAALARYKEAEAKAKAEREARKKAEAAAEAKRRAEDAKRREVEAKRASDERARAERELEKSQIDAAVAHERVLAQARRNRTILSVAAAAVLVVACGCALYGFIDRSRRAVAAEAFRAEALEKASRAERLKGLAASAREGDVAAAREVLSLVERGEVAESDVPGLYRIWMLLVNEGEVRAMFRLGVACHRGTCGVERSDANAHWFLSMAKRSGCKAPELDALLKATAAAAEDGAARSRDMDRLFAEKPAKGKGKEGVR
jgi:hypothetical protein